MRRYLTGHLDSDGYICVPPGRRGAKREKLHALVAEAFLGPRPAGAIVRHLSDEKRNNAVTNLAYGTRGDNAHDAIRNGLVDVADLRKRAAAVAPLGGKWWRGRKRNGRRGKAIR